MTLKGKTIIEGDIELLTGLHIGGSSATSDIGGIDNCVIKAVPRNGEIEGIPYIPGSSLKGKLRSLLAKEYSFVNVEQDGEPISTIFGTTNNAARLIVSDAMLDTERFKETFDQDNMDLKWTESKWENKINRVKGRGENPRQSERVPAGSVFHFRMIYDVFDDNTQDQHLKEIIRALRLLEDDYLGGSGTRGYGRVKINNLAIKFRTIADYYAKKDERKEKDITGEYWKN